MRIVLLLSSFLLIGCHWGQHKDHHQSPGHHDESAVKWSEDHHEGGGKCHHKKRCCSKKQYDHGDKCHHN